MATSPPQTAGAALVEFFSEFSAALFLRRSLYDRAARDPSTWRRAAVVVIVAALAGDSLGLYTDLDLVLVGLVGNWSVLAIMLLALARWATGTAAAHTVCRILGQDIAYRDLLSPSGYAHAPAALQLLPALVYMLDLTTVTSAMVSTVHWLAVPWVIAALVLAVLATGVSSLPHAVAVALVLFTASNLFDVLLDVALIAALVTTGFVPTAPDAAF